MVRPQKGRFVVSYALWEEKFSVTQLASTPGVAPRTVEGLSATAAETWCFDNLTMSTLGLAPNQYYWLRLELRTGTARDFADDNKIGISIHGSDRSAGPQEHRSHALGTAGDTRASGRSAPHGRPRVAKRVNRLRNRLILIFLAATLAPLAATIWITTSLLEESIDTSSTVRLDTLSKSLKGTARGLYERASDDLQAQGAAPARSSRAIYGPLDRASWPDAIKIFSGGLDGERVVRAGQEGNRLDYLVRHGNEIWVYSESLGDVAMDRLTREIRDARRAVEEANARDLRRGIKLTYIVLAAAIWLVSLALLVYLAHRISRPIQELTAGLGKLAAGDLNARVQARRDDEIGRAIGAFNNMAARLQESTERLVYLRQLASWQTLARKMAHEVKNSLTPIRLTVEEMLVRYDDADRGFMEQATQIVVDEIETLERRIRAFSQFAAEPPVQPGEVDVNGLLAGAHRVPEDGASRSGLRLPPGGERAAGGGGSGPAQGHPDQPAGERGRGRGRRRQDPRRDRGRRRARRHRGARFRARA